MNNYEAGGLIGGGTVDIPVTAYGPCEVCGYPLIETTTTPTRTDDQGREVALPAKRVVEHLIPASESKDVGAILRRISEAHIVAGIMHVERANREQPGE